MMASNSSDVELLLEEDRPQPTASFPKRVILALGLVGLCGLGVFAAQGARGRTRRASFGEFTLLAEDCFEYATFYANPHRMPGTARTNEINAPACQQRCHNTPGCMHFSYWPDGGCMLTGSESSSKAAPPRFSSTVSGPASCGSPKVDSAASGEELPATAAAAVDSGSHLLMGAGSLGNSGLVNGDDTMLSAAPPPGMDMAAASVDTPAVPKIEVPTVKPIKIEAVEVPTVKPIEVGDLPTLAPVKIEMMTGVNGTLCAKYPVCMEAGMTEGNCCPTDAHVNLGCCHGFPPLVMKGPKIEKGAACAAYPACMRLGLEGACCPALNGAKLGCCDDTVASS